MEIQKLEKSINNNGVKILLYAPSGAGKTSTLKTTGKTLLISLEGGELSLAGSDNVDILRPRSYDELKQAYKIAKENLDKYDTLAIDSLTELGEMIVAHLKKDPEFNSMKDGMKMWMRYSDLMYEVCKSFRDIGNIDVVLIALAETVKENFEDRLYPMIPAKKIQSKLPQLYDLVLYLNVDENSNRSIMTQPTSGVMAKDRSGKLQPVIEGSDLGQIIKIAKGETK